MVRAAAQTLRLLSAPRNFLILRALSGGPMGQLDLRRATGSPAQSTLRGQLKTLEEAGAIVRRRRDGFPGALEYELAGAGLDLLGVADHLSRWLEEAPEGALLLGGDPARAAVKGLVESWDARILAHLAEGPLSLTQLDKRLPAVSYPTIERRIETMRLAGQIEVGARTSAGAPYTIVPWVRLGLGPLAAAARWEHRHQPQGAEPLTRAEIESAFRIAAPLLALPPSFSGVCQLAARAPTAGQKRRRFLGVARISEGAVSFGEVHPARKPDAWASGTISVWFAVALDGDPIGLRTSGNTALLDALLKRIHSVLLRGG